MKRGEAGMFADSSRFIRDEMTANVSHVTSPGRLQLCEV